MFQNFTPRIHLSEADFANMTMNGALCNHDGELDLKAFELMIREQIKLFTLRQLKDKAFHTPSGDVEFTLLQTTKQIIVQQMFVEQRIKEQDEQWSKVLGGIAFQLAKNKEQNDFLLAHLMKQRVDHESGAEHDWTHNGTKKPASLLSSSADLDLDNSTDKTMR